jgi:hypothetical protein
LISLRQRMAADQEIGEDPLSGAEPFTTIRTNHVVTSAAVRTLKLCWAIPRVIDPGVTSTEQCLCPGWDERNIRRGEKAFERV